jgi:UDP-galactose transporter
MTRAIISASQSLKTVRSLTSKSIAIDKFVEKEKNKDAFENQTGKLGAIALTALVVQNSALTILMRMTRRVAEGSSTKLYIPTTAVVLSETLKLLISIIFFYKEPSNSNSKAAFSILKTELTENWLDIAKITIPSALYVVQNNLQFIAVSNLPAEVYQVLIQSKIVTTAICSYFLLEKRLSLVQWSSIFFLSLGVAIVQLSFPIHKATQSINYVIGFTAIFISCFTSGFAGVYFEKIMKSKPNTLWLRNIEMSLLSVLFALITSFSNDYQQIKSLGFFYGYNPLVLGVIALQAFGGILVSLVVKYSNSMTKGFATAGSIVLSCACSALLQDSALSARFFFGTSIVCLSTLAYSLPHTSLSAAAFLNASTSVSSSLPRIAKVKVVCANYQPETIAPSEKNEVKDLHSNNLALNQDCPSFQPTEKLNRRNYQN